MALVAVAGEPLRWADELLGHFRLDRSRRFTTLSKGEKGKLMMLQGMTS